MLKLSGWSRLNWGRERHAKFDRAEPHGPRSRQTPTPNGATAGRAGGDGPARVFQPTAPRKCPDDHVRSSKPRWEGRRQVKVRRPGRRALGRSLGRNLRSKTRWFTGFCNSHQVSHFATFFIVARAEISVAESRVWVAIGRSRDDVHAPPRTTSTPPAFAPTAFLKQTNANALEGGGESDPMVPPLPRCSGARKGRDARSHRTGST